MRRAAMLANYSCLILFVGGFMVALVLLRRTPSGGRESGGGAGL